MSMQAITASFYPKAVHVQHGFLFACGPKSAHKKVTDSAKWLEEGTKRARDEAISDVFRAVAVFAKTHSSLPEIRSRTAGMSPGGQNKR